jgi:hypothetical protein
MPDTHETFVFSTTVRNAPEDAVAWPIGTAPAPTAAPGAETEKVGSVVEAIEMPADWWDTPSSSGGAPMPDTTHESNLQALLRMIDGTDFPHTKGLRSWPEATSENQQEMHAACLALEQRGLIYRHYEDPATSAIMWMPVDTVAAD